jgi:DNA adenine methylase
MLKAPFPYFGGKSQVAGRVWSALGRPMHYLEPFFGSGAVLLSRPKYDQYLHTETVCDADGHIANVWRSIQSDPDEVAKWCDWPVNHADLIARKKTIER